MFNLSTPHPSPISFSIQPCTHACTHACTCTHAQPLPSTPIFYRTSNRTSTETYTTPCGNSRNTLHIYRHCPLSKVRQYSARVHHRHKNHFAAFTFNVDMFTQTIPTTKLFFFFFSFFFSESRKS